MQLRVGGNKREIKKDIQVVNVREIVSPTRAVTVEMKRSRLVQEKMLQPIGLGD